MPESRRSSHALIDGHSNLARASQIVANLPDRENLQAGCDEIKGALDAASGHCEELIRLLALEERVGLTAVRGNAQLALRRLDQTGVHTDTAALRTALRAILAATDRLIHHIEELEAVGSRTPSKPGT